MNDPTPTGGAWIAAEIRCSACTGKRGRTLIAVVYSDGARHWLLMNTYVRSTDEGSEVSAVPLPRLIGGDEDGPFIQSATVLDALQGAYPWMVMRLEDPSTIEDAFPLVSVSCPRCSPTGYNSSWLLDRRRIGQRLAPNRKVLLMASEVVGAGIDGASGPTLDRDLGYPPHAPPISTITEFLRRYPNAKILGDG